jgi:hypothetical protein
MKIPNPLLISILSNLHQTLASAGPTSSTEASAGIHGASHRRNLTRSEITRVGVKTKKKALPGCLRHRRKSERVATKSSVSRISWTDHHIADHPVADPDPDLGLRQ